METDLGKEKKRNQCQIHIIFNAKNIVSLDYQLTFLQTDFKLYQHTAIPTWWTETCLFYPSNISELSRSPIHSFYIQNLSSLSEPCAMLYTFTKPSLDALIWPFTACWTVAEVFMWSLNRSPSWLELFLCASTAGLFEQGEASQDLGHRQLSVDFVVSRAHIHCVSHLLLLPDHCQDTRQHDSSTWAGSKHTNTHCYADIFPTVCCWIQLWAARRLGGTFVWQTIKLQPIHSK